MKQKIFDILYNLKIDYKNYEHIPVFTCDDCKEINLPGVRVKSLLLKNKKSVNFYMVVLVDKKKLDTNIIKSMFGEYKISFASPERMMEKIGLKPGSVSPFALINNADRDIKVIFDSELKDLLIGFHPLQNDNTVILNMSGIERFLESIGIEFFYSDL